MPTYQAYGRTLYFQERGDGAPYVLLHGFGQHSGTWDLQAEQLARHFRVLTPDIRGVGRSEGAPPGFTAADLANDVVALLDHLKIERAHFAGWSLGGTVGLQLGLDHADRLLSLSLHSTFPGGRQEYQKNWIAMRRQIILSGNKELDIATRIIGFFSPEFVNEHPERIAEFRHLEADNAYAFSAEALAGMDGVAQQFEVRGRLTAIETPTLITVGSADRTTLPAGSHLMHALIRGSQLIIFDNAGHFPAFQVFEEFLTVSIGFSVRHTPRLLTQS